MRHDGADLELDRSGRIAGASPAGARALGYSAPAELIDRPAHETLHHSAPDGSPRPAEGCRLCRPPHEGPMGPRECYTTLRRADGTPRTVVARVLDAPTADAGPGIVLAPLNGLERAVAETLRLLGLAEGGYRLRRMVHDVSQPLSGMTLTAENALLRLRAGRADPDYLEQKLGRIADETHRLAGIVSTVRQQVRDPDPRPRTGLADLLVRLIEEETAESAAPLLRLAEPPAGAAGPVLGSPTIVECLLRQLVSWLGAASAPSEPRALELARAPDDLDLVLHGAAPLAPVASDASAGAAPEAPAVDLDAALAGGLLDHLGGFLETRSDGGIRRLRAAFRRAPSRS